MRIIHSRKKKLRKFYTEFYDSDFFSLEELFSIVQVQNIQSQHSLVKLVSVYNVKCKHSTSSS